MLRRADRRERILAFLAAGVMAAMGAAAFLLLVGRIEPLPWSGAEDAG